MNALAPLASIVARFAALLVPGWKVTFGLCPAADMPIQGALAVCNPTPTRSLAHLMICDPWPAGEDLAETIAHELVHACLSPLVALLPSSAAAIMLEEQAVENIGKALAASNPGEARAMARAAAEFAPARLRARISALAPRARTTGGTMDPKLITEALDALVAGDDAKCAEILKGLIAAAAGGEAGPPSADAPAADASGGAMPPAKMPDAGAQPGAPPAMKARQAMDEDTRHRARLDGEHARARIAADATVKIAVRARLSELRTTGALKLPTAREEELSKMTDLDAFERRVADMLEGAQLASPGTQRGRTDIVTAHKGAPPPNDHAGPPPVPAAELLAEGADQNWIKMYEDAHAHNPRNAEALLKGFRDPAAVRARKRAGVGRGAVN